ncbi:MAG TPA: carbon-nitrogen hydrolase family protein [Pirellulaceae bacterium]|jgi:predicted amidohydrolase|nr:carbon-nitrogen hydrolase family protein [Pirellulaceae bacterium]
MGTKRRLTAVQFDVAFMDVERNLQRMTDWTRKAAGEGADLVVFPECAATGYCFDSLEEALPYAQSIPGPATERMIEAARETGAAIVFGLLERDGDAIYNACVLVSPAGLLGTYRKIHLPYLGIDRFATPGDRPFAVHDWQGVRVGLNICYDAAFPESSRTMALAGADLIVLPTNWPRGAETTAEHAVPTRALENNVFYLAVNRAGEERGFAFIGRSRLCGLDGAVLAATEGTGEESFSYEVDLALARNKRIVRVPGLHTIDRFADRRPEMYGPITEPLPFVIETAAEAN